MRYATLSVLLLLIALSAVAAGCDSGGSGGSDGGSGSGGATTSVADRTFTVTPVSGFAIQGGIPNAVWMENEGRVVLIYSDNGLVEANSTDGVNFTGLGVVNQPLTDILDGLGLSPADVLLRQISTGRRYIMIGLPPPGTNDRDIYAADLPVGGSLALANGGSPVYSGGAPDSHSMGVPDITPTSDGRWRMTYVSPFSGNGNCSTAVSSDEGLTWIFEDDDPFQDSTLSGAANVNVDPGPLRLSDGTWMAVTMRATELFFWNSEDGLNWSEVPNFRVDVSGFQSVAPGATGLFDPTLVQLPDGTIYMYVTAGGGANDYVVAAVVAIQ